MTKLIKKVLITSIIFNLTSMTSIALAHEMENNTKFNLKELVLPSEIGKLGKSPGALYYSSTIKDKVLMPVHFWGQVGKSGLHYLPMGTTVINGISMAGGPKTDAILDEIKLTRRNGDQINEKVFNISEGGDKKAYFEQLRPGDTIFIKRSTFREDRIYYTGLIGIMSTLLSSILLWREVKK
jgi:hypothetical protein